MKQPDPLKKFESALKSWAEQPPAMTPEEAARAIRIRLPDQRRSWLLRPFVLVPVCIVLGLIVFTIQLEKIPAPEPVVSIPSPLDQVPASYCIPANIKNMVVIWIDRNTPLYMVFRTEHRMKGKTI